MITYFTTDGRQVAEQEALDGSGILKSGFKMRSKLTLRDGFSSYQLTDADKRKCDQIDRYEAKLADAWRDSRPVADQATAPAADVYERYDRRVADAWRS